MAKSPKLYKKPLKFDGADLSDVKLGNGCFIPIIDKFCYLETWLTRDEENIIDVKMGVEKAGAAFGPLRKFVFSCRRVSPHAKKLVYAVLVLPVLLYG